MAKLKIGSPNRGATLDSTSITPDLSHYLRNDERITDGVINTLFGGTLTLQNSTIVGPKLEIKTGNMQFSRVMPKSVSVFYKENGTTNNFAYSVDTSAMYVSKSNTDGNRSVTLDVSNLAPEIELSSTAGKTTLSQDASANLEVNKVIKAVTPTDSTDKSQLVTIEYLESVLQNYQHV